MDCEYETQTSNRVKNLLLLVVVVFLACPGLVQAEESKSFVVSFEKSSTCYTDPRCSDGRNMGKRIVLDT